MVVKTVFRNTFALTAARIISMFLTFLLLVFVARNLGSEPFGNYNFALILVSFFIIVAEFGFSNLVIRDVAKEKSRVQKYLSNVLVLRFLLVIAALLVLVLFIENSNYSPHLKTIVYIVALASFINSLSQVFRYHFQSFEVMEFESLVVIIQSIIFFLFGMLVLLQGFGLLEVVIVYLFANIISFILSAFLVLAKISRFSWNIDFKLWRSLLLDGFIFALITIFLLVYTKINVLFLEHFFGSAVVGLYTASQRLVESLIVIQTNFLIAIYPALSVSFHADKVRFFRLFEKSFKLLVVVGLPIAVFLFIAAEKIVLFIYGVEFLESVAVLRVISWIVPLSFLNGLLFYSLFAVNKQRAVAAIFCVIALLGLLLNFYLVPLFGLLGASVSFLASEALLFILAFHFFSTNIFRVNLTETLFKPALWNAFTAFLIMGMLLLDTPIILLFLLSVAFYAVPLYPLGIIDKTDVALIKQVLPKTMQKVSQ